MERFPPLSPDPLDDLTAGYRASRVVLSAVELGVFESLANAPLGPQEVAKAIQGDERAAEMLLQALAGLRLLEKEQERYSLSTTARRYLLESSPNSRVAMMGLLSRQYDYWGQLTRIVRTGSPAEKQEQRTEPGHEQKFAQAMAVVGRRSARKCVSLLDLSRTRKILDVGGGPGLYASAFAVAQPEAQVTLLDRENTLEVAKENIQAAGVAERVRLLTGDIFSGDYGGSYDFVFLSNVAHMYSFEENQELVERLASALEPGGVLCVKDFILEDSRTEPLGAVLFAVNMLVNTERGCCYTESDIRSWFRSAHLEPADTLELTEQSKLLLAVK